jgi:hypothetical protein
MCTRKKKKEKRKGKEKISLVYWVKKFKKKIILVWSIL